MIPDHDIESSAGEVSGFALCLLKVEHIHRKSVFILFLLIMVITTTSVLARNADLPLMWTEELARALFIWLICLGAALAVRNGSHLSLKLLDQFLSPKIMNLMNCLLQIVSSVLLVILIEPVIVLIQTGASTSTTMLQIPWSLLYLPFGISVLLMIIYHANTVFQLIGKYGSDS